MRRLVLALALGLLSCMAHAGSLPRDSGAINVRDYGATGNGVTDDTKALLAAIAASGGDTGATFWRDHIVYLPDGVYRVSAPLLKRYANGGFASGLMLVGQSRAGTIIRLTDGAPGFGDAHQPEAVIFSTSKLLAGSPTAGGKNYAQRGEGNDAYMNSVEDLTVDVGTGNPGAIGIDYLANNLGAIRDVLVTAGSGSGAVGISMTRKWPGPALLSDVEVRGFGIGIDVAQPEYALTFEHVRLLGTREIGLRNDGNSLAIRDLVVESKGTAIANTSAAGLIAMADSRLDSSGDGDTAIANAGTIVMRNVRVAGMLREVRVGGGLAPPREGLSGTLTGAEQWVPQAAEPKQPALRAAEPPDAPHIPADEWVNVARFGALPDSPQDPTDGLRRAFASGAATVYLPQGTYEVSGPIDIPPTLRRIVGMNATLKVAPHRPPDFARSSGVLRVRTQGQPLVIERLAFENYNMGPQVAIELAAPRDTVIRDVIAAGATLVDRKSSGGRLFLEDTCCGTMVLAGAQPVYARQLDTEGGGVRIQSTATPLWILGLKTEGNCTVLDARDGAVTDIFGGLLYMVAQTDTPVPAFRIANSVLSATYAEASLRPRSHYDVYVQDAAGSEVDVAAFPTRGYGRIVPALSAGR
jgi:hypothetical protein